MPTLTCPTCSQDFHVPNYRAGKAKYCSRTCMAVGYSQAPAFYVPPKTRKQVNCLQCHAEFEVEAARANHGRGKYCSRECQYAAQTGQRAQTQMQNCICLCCGTQFSLFASKIKQQKGSGKYCSRKCRDEHRKGQQHPGFISGSAGEHRGSNWQSQKRKVKSRDKHQCQHCGMDEPASKVKFGQSLHVHHIRPYYLFATYHAANQMDNLITLCPRCHRIADANHQRSRRPPQPL